MKRILKISMDVHSTNYTLCAMEPTIGAEDLTLVPGTMNAANGENRSATIPGAMASWTVSGGV